MKTCCSVFILLAMLCVVAVCDITDGPNKACMAETKITEAEVQKMNSDPSAKPSDNYKCFVKCVITNLGFMKGDAYNADAAIKSLQAAPTLKGREAEVVKVVNACKDTKGANPCDMAYNVADCIMVQGLKMRR